MHCYFVLAGAADVPVVYHVERVREGRSFATRTVQAKQSGRCIFTTMLSFVREGSGGQRVLEHSTPMSDVPPPPPIKGNSGSNGDGGGGSGGGEDQESETSGWPFQSVGLETLNGVYFCDLSFLLPPAPSYFPPSLPLALSPHTS